MSLLPAPIVEALHHTLSAEIEDYRQLLWLAQRERVALHSGSLVDLMATTQDKTGLLQRLAEWEASRQGIVATLAEKLKLPMSASLADLIACCDEAVGQTFSALHQEFRGLAEQLNTLNQESQLLLQAELVRVNATMSYLLSNIGVGAGYTVKGAATPSSPAPLAGNVLNWHI